MHSCLTSALNHSADDHMGNKRESKTKAHLHRKHIAVFHVIGCRREAALVIEGVELLHLNHYHYNVGRHNENCSADRGFCCWGFFGWVWVFFCQFPFCIHMRIVYTWKYGCTNFCGGGTRPIGDLRQELFRCFLFMKSKEDKD